MHARCFPRAKTLALATLLLVANAICCQRKAPSIDQCQEMAAHLLGVGSQSLRDPQVRAKFEQVAFECLTTPYDQQLFRCLRAGSDAELCGIEFRQREKLAPLQSEPGEGERFR